MSDGLSHRLKDSVNRVDANCVKNPIVKQKQKSLEIRTVPVIEGHFVGVTLN